MTRLFIKFYYFYERQEYFKTFFFSPPFSFLILSVRAKMLKEAEATATEELKIFRAKEKERLTKGHKEVI